ncbi:MAG: hypothetical protein MR357_06215 [Anaeroplasma sp.]|nr:hypothetical protein [Anaeroplasma sp.]
MTIILLFIFCLLIINSNITKLAVISTCKLWLSSLVPVLYPTSICLDLLFKSYYIDLFCFYLYKPFSYIFNIKSYKSIELIIISIICGAPLSTKIIKKSIEENTISNHEGNMITIFFSSFSISYIIYISSIFNSNIFKYYFTYFIFSIIFMHLFNKPNDKNIENNRPQKTNNNFINLLFDSITKNTNIMLFILGIMIILKSLLDIFHTPIIIYSYFEILNGNNLLITLGINKKLKEAILFSSLSFLGFSSHLQIIYVYPEIKYKLFFIYRFFIGFSFFIIFFI